MLKVIIPEDAIATMLWDVGSLDDFDEEDTDGIHDALFANLMGWA